MDMVTNGGRAVVVPIWAGTYQRFVPAPKDPKENYDRLRRAALRWYEDAATTIAYLYTREKTSMSIVSAFSGSAGEATYWVRPCSPSKGD